MARRILVAILITLAILSITRRLSMNRPRDIHVAADSVEVYHRTVTEQVGPGRPFVSAKVSPSKGVSCFVEIYEGGGSKRMIELEGDTLGNWRGYLPEKGKGEKIGYAILIRTKAGAAYRVPRDAGDYFVVKYKGPVSGFVLVSHIAFMFGSFFFMVLALFGAIRILKGLEDKKVTVNLVRWVLLLTFIGGWPLGWILNYQAFGILWEGFPFGYDVTDNKTQIMFVFWIVTSLLAAGSVFKGDEGSDKLGARGFAIAVIVSVLVSIGVFLIPHSL